MLDELSLAQQFEMKRMTDAANSMSKEQALELLMQATRLLMVKTNVIRNLEANLTEKRGCHD